MEENNKCMEVVIRLFDNYVDLWFKNELMEYMKNQNGVSTVDLLFQLTLFKDNLFQHLVDNVRMDKMFSVNLIEHLIEEKHEQHLKGLISSLT